jgi:hypothetical protein
VLHALEFLSEWPGCVSPQCGHTVPRRRDSPKRANRRGGDSPDGPATISAAGSVHEANPVIATVTTA